MRMQEMIFTSETSRKEFYLCQCKVHQGNKASLKTFKDLAGNDNRSGALQKLYIVVST